MSDHAAQSTPPRPVSPPTCYFTRTALLTVPPQWRTPFVHLGEAIYEIMLEVVGIAPEARSGLEVTARELIAIGGDLRIAADQLDALGREPEASDLSKPEERLCALAGRMGVQVREISRELVDAGRGIGPDGLQMTREE